MRRTSRPASPTARQRNDRRAARLDALIEEATVDAHDESEQKAGFFTMLENHLVVPFSTEVLGTTVTVETIDRMPHCVSVASRCRAIRAK
jgi:hypothetical protein